MAVAAVKKELNPKQMGAIGLCFGGLCALDLARSGADLQGVVSIHGLLNPPNYPSKPRAKILALHGHDDPVVPPDQVLAFEKEMSEAGADWQVHVYGGTMHAFTVPTANDPIPKHARHAIEHFFGNIYQL
nr:dienelactone hydrolase family protein [Candidatus Neptunochlamydia vexilliferae]